MAFLTELVGRDFVDALEQFYELGVVTAASTLVQWGIEHFSALMPATQIVI